VRQSRRTGGAVLLEVVLALVLFVAAAAVITAGFRSSVTGVDRLRDQTHAVNLAVTVFSEIEMGIRPAQAGGPENFDPPFDEWTWALEIAPPEDLFSETAGPSPVEVIIRNELSGTVYRLARHFPPAATEPLDEAGFAPDWLTGTVEPRGGR
jgi:hypothetical protein